MSKKARKLAAALAVAASGSLLTKGAAYAVTPADMMPLAAFLTRMDRDAKRAERVEKLLARNARTLERLTAPDPTLPVSHLHSATGGADHLLAKIDDALESHTRGLAQCHARHGLT